MWYENPYHPYYITSPLKNLHFYLNFHIMYKIGNPFCDGSDKLHATFAKAPKTSVYLLFSQCINYGMLNTERSVRSVITLKRPGTKPDQTMIYMEVYGINRVIYRVTASTVRRRGRPVTVYGVALEDARTGMREVLENFSEDMEQTVQFANTLVRKNVRPNGLYNEALRQLRMPF